MCCCPKPSVNGEVNAYSWDGKSLSTRTPAPPALKDGDVVLYDEPGRCGGIDSHCHHLTVVENGRAFAIMVRHGGGDERLPLGHRGESIVEPLALMDSNTRYWFLLKIMSLTRDLQTAARDETRRTYAQAFVDGRLKKGRPRNGAYHVTIEPKKEAPNA